MMGLLNVSVTVAYGSGKRNRFPAGATCYSFAWLTTKWGWSSRGAKAGLSLFTPNTTHHCCRVRQRLGTVIRKSQQRLLFERASLRTAIYLFGIFLVLTA